MRAIVAVDLNWGIGINGELLQRIPEDMRNFKQMTIGKVVVMGRKTFESLPGKEPLKDRVNIVLSNNKNFKNEKVTVCRSSEELFCELKKYKQDDIFVIGGELIYTQLLPYCNEVFVTKIQSKYIADKHFVDLDKEEIWELVSSSDLKNHKDIYFNFNKYINNRVEVLAAT